jgi:hypothetical protein
MLAHHHSPDRVDRDHQHHGQEHGTDDVRYCPQTPGGHHQGRHAQHDDQRARYSVPAGPPSRRGAPNRGGRGRVRFSCHGLSPFFGSRSPTDTAALIELPARHVNAWAGRRTGTVPPNMIRGLAITGMNRRGSGRISSGRRTAWPRVRVLSIPGRILSIPDMICGTPSVDLSVEGVAV